MEDVRTWQGAECVAHFVHFHAEAAFFIAAMLTGPQEAGQRPQLNLLVELIRLLVCCCGSAY